MGSLEYSITSATAEGECDGPAFTVSLPGVTGAEALCILRMALDNFPRLAALSNIDGTVVLEAAEEAVKRASLIYADNRVTTRGSIEATHAAIVAAYERYQKAWDTYQSLRSLFGAYGG